MSDAATRNRRGKKQQPRAGESPAGKAEPIPVLKPAEQPPPGGADEIGSGIRVTASGPFERAGHISPSRPGQHEEIIECPPLITQEVNKWRYEHPWQTQTTQQQHQPEQPSTARQPEAQAALEPRGSWTTTPTGMPIYQLVQQQTERAMAGVRDRLPASIPAAADAARARAGSALEAASRMPPLTSGAVPVPSIPLEKVGPVLLAAAAVLASGLRNMLQALGEYVPALAAEVEEVAPQVFQLGQQGYYRVQEALPVVGERLGAAAQSIPQAARRTGQAVASTAGSVAHTVSDATGNVAHAVGDVTGSVAQSVGNVTGNIVHSVEDAAGNVIHTVTDTTGNVIHTFVETASAVRARLADTASTILPGGRYHQQQQPGQQKQHRAPSQQQQPQQQSGRMQLYRTDEQVAADQRGFIASAIDAVKSVLPVALGGTTTSGRGIVSKVGDLVTLRPLTAAWRGESTTSGTRSSTEYMRRGVNLGRGVQPLPIKPARGSHFARPHTDKLMWSVPTGEGVGEWAALAKSQRAPVHVRHSQDEPIRGRGLEGGKVAQKQAQPQPQLQQKGQEGRGSGMQAQQKQAQGQQQQQQAWRGTALGGAGTGGQYTKQQQQGFVFSQALTHPEPSMPFPAASSFATPGLAALSSAGLPVSPAEPHPGASVQRAL